MERVGAGPFFNQHGFGFFKVKGLGVGSGLHKINSSNMAHI